MSVRSVLFACVCTAFLAAPAALTGSAAAEENPSLHLVSQGYDALVAGQTTDAISAFTEAIESRQLTPEQLANTLLNRALAYQQGGTYQHAIDDYTAALRIDALGAKLRATALYNRGLAYNKLKQSALAIEDFTSAVMLDPEFAHAYFSRATVLRESGQYLFALSDYEKALRYNHPQAYLVYYGEALAHEALNRPNAAKRSLAKAIAANPSFESARQKLAMLEGDGSSVRKPADIVVTASVTDAGGDQVVRKEELPEAIKPPEELAESAEIPPADPTGAEEADALLGGQPVGTPKPRPVKTINDRVPDESDETSAAVVMPPKDKPKQSAAEIKVVAVEALPDAEPVPKTKRAKVAISKPEAQVSRLSGWNIQISSAKNEKIAWNVWTQLKAKHAILAGQKAVVLRADLGTKGVYYRLRLNGFGNKADAQDLCGKLKSRGVSCFVSRADS